MLTTTLHIITLVKTKSIQPNVYRSNNTLKHISN